MSTLETSLPLNRTGDRPDGGAPSGAPSPGGSTAPSRGPAPLLLPFLLPLLLVVGLVLWIGASVSWVAVAVTMAAIVGLTSIVMLTLARLLADEDGSRRR